MDKIDPSFLGRGWSFPPTFRRSQNGVDLLSGEADVRSSLQVILGTMAGERVMLPHFGSNLQQHVFQVMNLPNLAMIEKVVRDALVYHEPRIRVEEVSARPSQEAGLLEIHIQYAIVTTNTRYNMVYPFYINEATNVER